MNGYNGFKKNLITKKIKIGEFMTEQDIQAVLNRNCIHCLADDNSFLV